MAGSLFGGNRQFRRPSTTQISAMWPAVLSNQVRLTPKNTENREFSKRDTGRWNGAFGGRRPVRGSGGVAGGREAVPSVARHVSKWDERDLPQAAGTLTGRVLEDCARCPIPGHARFVNPNKPASKINQEDAR